MMEAAIRLLSMPIIMLLIVRLAMNRIAKR